MEIDSELIGDIITTAFEGGSNYWISEVNVVGDFKEESASEHLASGGILQIIPDDPVETEDDDVDIEYKITTQDVVTAIETLLNTTHWTLEQLVTDFDAASADAILQQALFGEIVYG